WTRRHRFCGACGQPTTSREAGHVRACTNENCGVLHFPRTDPAVIMVVEHEDRCLLAHQKGWPGRLHSCLAGFVEPGESAEEAVVREVKEESGVVVRDVQFFATQPWPYPCSLMLGFYAMADDGALTLDDIELEEARWFSRDELRSPDLDIELPRHDSIARRLIDEWIDRSQSRSR
ncbi:MAG: NAD(+) diphosphatase, partial [Rhodospirillaceae bacterium]|nr:NAD(+) diphosphatase [Rhodospirillaceae bacterium]